MASCRHAACLQPSCCGVQAQSHQVDFQGVVQGRSEDLPGTILPCRATGGALKASSLEGLRPRRHPACLSSTMLLVQGKTGLGLQSLQLLRNIQHEHERGAYCVATG